MKTPKDPRHLKRRRIVKELFAKSFIKQKSKNKLAEKIFSNRKKIDEEIQTVLESWPIDKINKIDLAILRLAVYELKETKTPHKVIIDEAVELAKEFGNETSPSFVNGVLATIHKRINKTNEGGK